MFRQTSHWFRAILVTAALGAVLAGCGDDRAAEKPKPAGGHVWRGQTDMYFEARDVAKDVNAQASSREAAVERARKGE